MRLDSLLLAINPFPWKYVLQCWIHIWYLMVLLFICAGWEFVAVCRKTEEKEVSVLLQKFISLFQKISRMSFSWLNFNIVTLFGMSLMTYTVKYQYPPYYIDSVSTRNLILRLILCGGMEFLLEWRHLFARFWVMWWLFLRILEYFYSYSN